METQIQQRVNSPCSIRSDPANLDQLLEINRPRLKKIFISHSCADKMSYQEFFKFCKRATIIPELSSIMEVKQIYSKFTIAHKLLSKPETTPILSFPNFEELLQQIAQSSIKTCETLQGKLEAFINHIRGPIKKNYKLNLLAKRQILSDKKNEIEEEKNSDSQIAGQQENEMVSGKNSIPGSSRGGSEKEKEPIENEISKSPDEQEKNNKSDGKIKAKNNDIIDSNIDLALKVLNMPKKDSSTQLTIENNEDPTVSKGVSRFSAASGGGPSAKRYRNSYSNERLALQHDGTKDSFEKAGNRTGTHQSSQPAANLGFSLENIKEKMNNATADKQTDSRKGSTQDVVVQRILEQGVDFVEDNEELKEFLEIEQSLNKREDPQSAKNSNTRYQEYMATSPKNDNSDNIDTVREKQFPSKTQIVKPMQKEIKKEQRSPIRNSPRNDKRRNSVKANGPAFQENLNKKRIERNATTISPPQLKNKIKPLKKKEQKKSEKKRDIIENKKQQDSKGNSFNETGINNQQKTSVTKINLNNSSFDKNSKPPTANIPKTAKNNSTNSKGFNFEKNEPNYVSVSLKENTSKNSSDKKSNSSIKASPEPEIKITTVKNFMTVPNQEQKMENSQKSSMVKSAIQQPDNKNKPMMDISKKSSPDKIQVMQSFLDVKEKLLISQAEKIENYNKFIHKILDKNIENFQNITKKAIFTSWSKFVKLIKNTENLIKSKVGQNLRRKTFFAFRKITRNTILSKQKAIKIISEKIKNRLSKFLINLNSESQENQHEIYLQKALQFGNIISSIIYNSKNILNRSKKQTLQKLMSSSKQKMQIEQKQEKEKEMKEFQQKLSEEAKKSKAYQAELQKLRERFGKVQDVVKNWPQIVKLNKID